MSQFRKTGFYYVSKWGGNDANSGTDPLMPKASISSLPNENSISIIGPGVYNGIWSGVRNLVGDGKVIVDFKNSGVNQTAAQYAKNIWFKNLLAQFSGVTQDINNCIYENITTINIGTFNRLNIFLSHFQITGNSNFRDTENSIILEGNDLSVNGLQWRRFNHNFLSKNATMYQMQSVDINSNKFGNNLFNGLYRNGGVGAQVYESKRLFNGSPRPDANPLIPDIIDIIPDFYNWGNFSGDPKFIDVINRTVHPDSDLLKKSNLNGFIGGVKPGQYINFQNSDFVITFQNIDTSNPDLIRIADGFDFGKIRITGKVSDTLISSQAVDIRIPFFFDSGEPGGDPLNNNVPDAVHGLRGLDTLGDLPYRLRFEVRSSQMPNASRFNNDEWDNDISGIAGRWYLMEYGQPMLHHIVASVAYGNADKFAINAPVKTPFNYRSLDIEITLSNDRSQV